MTRWLIVGFGVLACALLPGHVTAQTVLFRIVDDETSAPVFGTGAIVRATWSSLEALGGDARGASVRDTIPENQAGALLEIRRQ